ncbi:UvrD-helicase domain-containing protein [Sulfitobacter sp. W002]|uniref:UvrD-helicase domain-containing protein n=1 Tax=Sulfitobacter sp. W002 TaxID=2867024 RepID=UPI0021A3A578|nr:UvrD-helicase domain-containing protein [Sulfitobacter sp. W002]UWR31467.1 UvrD-helicase domain-containing protein [Sulfitobacter sp. W002]
MSDQTVHDLLRSDRPLVVIEAPAGCGKTFQGATYAQDIAPKLGKGRMLILTHTNAACDVFAEKTKGLPRTKVEIKTIDSLIIQVAGVYHEVLGLPRDPTTWAYANDNGFDKLATKVSKLLTKYPMIPSALARRYPVIVCDEHQDASPERHAIIMKLFEHGAHLRVFGDRMQSIYERTVRGAERQRERWQRLVDAGVYGELDQPHRWMADGNGCSELGAWVLRARETLLAGGTVDLTRDLPSSVNIIRAENVSPTREGYQVDRSERPPLNRCLDSHTQLFVLANSNGLVRSLRSFWFRRVPIWEGHTRSALAQLISDIERDTGDALKLGNALIEFMSAIGTGFSRSAHGNILLAEISCECSRPRTRKPANIQALAKIILGEPNHVGLAKAIRQVDELMRTRAEGFTDIKIDLWREFREAQTMAQFSDLTKAFAEINMRRSVSRPKPPSKSISTVHKAKGLECNNVMLVHCDRGSFGDTIYGRCKLYVALSRAKSSLTLVIPNNDPSPLLAI